MGYINSTPDSETFGASAGPQGPQGLLGPQGPQGPQRPQGPQDLQGGKGIGFKLGPDNNFDLEDKKIVNLEVLVDYKNDDPY